jgi:hypothetical protein
MLGWIVLSVAGAATCEPGPRTPWTRTVTVGEAAEGRVLAAIATSDLDGDGQAELYGLLAAADGTGALALWATVIDERGPLSPVRPVPLPTGAGAAGQLDRIRLWGADADGDGHRDLLVFDGRGEPTLGLWRGHGDGGTTQAWLGPARALDLGAIRDVDADGADELLAIADAGQTWVVELDGTRAGAGPVSPVAPLVGACLADLDADGSLDLVAAGGASRTIAVMPARAPAGAVSVRARSRDASAVGCGDLDGDGDDDALVLDGVKGRLRWLQGGAEYGMGPVVAELAVEERDRPHGVWVADLDADGCADWVVDQTRDETLLVGWGHGDGTWSVESLAVGAAPVTLGDVDGDGHDELLVVAQDRASVTVVDATPAPQ